MPIKRPRAQSRARLPRRSALSRKSTKADSFTITNMQLPLHPGGRCPGPPILSINNLSHRYPGASKQALSQLSFQISPGDCLGLLGPEGAGKSTLLQLLAGLLGVQRGSIMLHGTLLHQASRAAWQDLAWVPQQPAFYPLLTVRENIQCVSALYPRKRRACINRLIDDTGLARHARARAASLSASQQQRLNFAIGLVNRPRLLLLDEITAGADPASRQLIRENINRLNRQGVTIIYASAQLQEMETLCQNLLLLDRGLLVCEGRMANMLDRCSQNRVLFKPLRPLSSAELSMLDGRLLANGAVEIQADQQTALHIWQELGARDIGTAYFQAGHRSLESFYLDFLQQRTP